MLSDTEKEDKLQKTSVPAYSSLILNYAYSEWQGKVQIYQT